MKSAFDKIKILKKSGIKNMNVFEDLIDELKEENLIEQTVIETSQAEEAEKNENQLSANSSVIENVSSSVASNGAVAEVNFETIECPAESISEHSDKLSVNKTEFYRQRATSEVSFLQMVEAAFAGVEREQLKSVPRQFDDLTVKKVLHSFLQVAGNADSPEYSKAEFQLLRETENWYSSLSLRDTPIMTAHLRRYCETSRPPLSSPALVALARFYRNSPYSEQVRSKFDLVISRLFSKEVGTSKREVVFSRDELIKHLQELYADWSSVPLYSIEENDDTITQIAQKFEDFIREAEAADSFDSLITGDFFNRLRLFKENCSENFYAPKIAALGIECNIRVGNRYVELLEKEKETGNIAVIENKYGLSHDQTISEATGKTLSLVELLKQKNAAPKLIEQKNIVVIEPIVRQEIKKPEKSQPKQTDDTMKSKKIIVAIAFLAVIIMLGIYFAS